MTILNFCGEVFLDFNVTLNSTNPKFSNCFQQIVFSLFPCISLWLLALPYFLATRSSSLRPIFVSLLFKCKMITTVLLWLLAWIELLAHVWRWGQVHYVPPVDLVVPLIVGVSMLDKSVHLGVEGTFCEGIGKALALLFTQFDRLKGVRSSALLSGYWFILVVTWGFMLKEKVDRIMLPLVSPLTNIEVIQCVTFFISYACVVINAVLCFFADNPPSCDKKECGVDAELDSLLSEKRFSRGSPSPEEGCTFISKITFWWFTRMIIAGYKRPLVDGDLWKLNSEDRSAAITRRFTVNWEKELAKANNSSVPLKSSEGKGSLMTEEVFITMKKKKASLLFAMCKTFGPYFLISTFLKVIQDALAFVSPQFLKMLINFISSDSPQWHGYAIAVALFATALAQNIILQQYFHICFVVGMRLRSALIAAIYKKALVLSNAAKKKSTVGEIVNLMSVDAQRFMDLMSYLNIVWSGPFQIILALYFLWEILGPSVLAGLAVMILLIPINAYLGSKARSFQVKQMGFKDDRMKLMNELLNGIKALKMYAWEISFKDKVSAIRKHELDQLRRAAYLNAVSIFTVVCAPFVVSVTTFAVYVLSDEKNVLDAQKAFVSLSLFNLLRFPLNMLPTIVTSIVQASVSLQRLEGFLNSDELDQKSVDRNPGSSKSAIIMKEVNLKWDLEEPPVLSKISLTIKSGSLVAVVGQVGCGKSSLLSAMLGDMVRVSGRMSVMGSVAYVPQQPWIQNLTVHENITFGQAMQLERYEQVVADCELKSDFKMLPAGDQTEIGERGINLSGGQKQRVAIARAVYQDCDVYLFDDPLSAVDAHVGKNIFDKVIGPEGCLKNKIRVLVTHGLSFLPQVDRIYVMVEGRVTEAGSYNELLSNKGAFSEFLKMHAQADDEEKDPTATSVCDVSSLKEEDVNLKQLVTTNTDSTKQRSCKVLSAGINGPSCCKSASIKTDSEEDLKNDKLIQAEKTATGNVKLSVFAAYMKAIGYILFSFILLFYVLQNVAQIYSSIWLAEWSNDPVSVNGTQEGTEERLAVYGVLGFCQAFFVMLASILWANAYVAAASFLHYNMLLRVFRSPTSFFDTTPIGRIINRFSKDVYTIDDLLPRALGSFVRILVRTIGSFVAIIYGTPWFASVIVPLLILYFFIQRFYVKTSRQLKRLESVSRSPIFSHFSETITGASTIRAYSLQNSFIKQNEAKVDTNQMSYYPNIVSNRWLAVRLEFIGNCIVLFAAIFAVAAKDSIEPGTAGLTISYAMQVTQTLNCVVRQSSELETNIVAVERVEEYSKIEQEAPLECDEDPQSDDWPPNGSIVFNQYSTRYRKELDLVVKNISINIKGGEKIGIVGRTGAGKSSLTLALFRIIEAVKGSIIIDGKNISKLGLKKLRGSLAVIPQDPVLFSGTLRSNLDPFEKHSDAEVWRALEHSHLKNFVGSLPSRLEFVVSEGGENMSVGQRQLVCLARALLRKSKILVLDEATAAVDLETDDLIQGTIRTEFHDCTTFTIAHRLNTIMDSTRVLVLDAGKVAEFDSPINLIKTKGIFYEMAKDAGLV